MPSPLSSFLQRMRLMRQARARLEAGAPEQALDILRTGGIAESEAAQPLRRACADTLVALVRRRADEGSPEEAQRLLQALAQDDPERARQLANAVASPPEPASQRDSKRLLGYLAQMRSRSATAGHGLRRPAPAAPAVAPQVDSARPLRFLMGVDDAGDFLVLAGASAVLGHVRSGNAALPFLCDIEDEHARITFQPGGFHRAPAWRIEPLGSARVLVRGRDVEPGEPRSLFDGDHVRLSHNLAFQVRAPSSASTSLVLDLEEGAQCEGAQHVLVLMHGPSGRVTLGAHALDHVQVPGMGQQVSLEIAAHDGSARLRVSAAAELRQVGVAGGATQLELPCPPTQRIDVVLPPEISGARPRGFSLRPLES